MTKSSPFGHDFDVKMSNFALMMAAFFEAG